MDETIVPTTITPDADYATELTGLFDLRGRTVFVPGGTGGLGEAIAWGLSLSGASVGIAARRRRLLLGSPTPRAAPWPACRSR